ncbi:MAG: hypothetical protein R3F37_22450 [Candidatus Competibacteraceae bacterium]
MEMLYAVAGWRAPFVLVNVSRALAALITLEPDHNDILAARDSGFRNCIARLAKRIDSVLLAYRLAEDARVRLPVIVNLDGFYLLHPGTGDDPDSRAVQQFLPPFDPHMHCFSCQRADQPSGMVLGGSAYSYFRYEMHLPPCKRQRFMTKWAQSSKALLCRSYPAVDAYRCEDAEWVFSSPGSFATKAKAAVGSVAGRRLGDRVTG